MRIAKHLEKWKLWQRRRNANCKIRSVFNKISQKPNDRTPISMTTKTSRFRGNRLQFNAMYLLHHSRDGGGRSFSLNSIWRLATFGFLFLSLPLVLPFVPPSSCLADVPQCSYYFKVIRFNIPAYSTCLVEYGRMESRKVPWRKNRQTGVVLHSHVPKENDQSREIFNFNWHA